MSILPAGSQEGQDRWVLDEVFRGKVGGYFFEAGAGDGKYLSNTWLLETSRHWDGILVEPSSMFRQLRANRAACCDNSVLGPEKGYVEFIESDRSSEFGEDRHHHLSGIVNLLDCWHPSGRAEQREARPILDVLAYWRAPVVIDYLSLDLEGAEFEVLRTFPWEQHHLLAITVEHNNVEPKRTNIRELLASKGYRFERATQHDDWYLSERLKP